jgi:hypothetical protein
MRRLRASAKGQRHSNYKLMTPKNWQVLLRRLKKSYDLFPANAPKNEKDFLQAKSEILKTIAVVERLSKKAEKEKGLVMRSKTRPR